MTTHRINSMKTAAVSTVQEWLPIDENTPIGMRILVINKASNYTHIYEWDGKDKFWTHWAPFPMWPTEP